MERRGIGFRPRAKRRPDRTSAPRPTSPDRCKRPPRRPPARPAPTPSPHRSAPSRAQGRPHRGRDRRARRGPRARRRGHGLRPHARRAALADRAARRRSSTCTGRPAGFTAPLFLLVSGWAVSVAIRAGGARGLDVPRGRVGRVLLLLCVGYALRWPGWGLDRLAAGDPEVWAHLLAFDALHTIAIALLTASLVLALPWSRREQAWAFGALAVLCVALGMLAPAPLAPSAAALSRPRPSARAGAGDGRDLAVPGLPVGGLLLRGCGSSGSSPAPGAAGAPRTWR